MSAIREDLHQRPRDKLRFAIEKNVCYQCLNRGRILAIGVGKTIQISSREVRFTTQDPLKQGETVCLQVEWPVMLDNTCLLKLQIRGQVIQILPGGAAVSIARYEFRTRGAARVVAIPYAG